MCHRSKLGRKCKNGCGGRFREYTTRKCNMICRTVGAMVVTQCSGITCCHCSAATLSWLLDDPPNGVNRAHSARGRNQFTNLAHRALPGGCPSIGTEPCEMEGTLANASLFPMPSWMRLLCPAEDRELLRALNVRGEIDRTTAGYWVSLVAKVWKPHNSNYDGCDERKIADGLPPGDGKLGTSCRRQA